MAIQEQTFTVEAKGVGKPDNYKSAAPARSILSADQRKWYSLYYGEIGPLSFVTVPIYTGTAGWHLFVGGGFLSVNADVMCSGLIEIQVPPLPFIGVINYWWKLQGQIVLPEPAVVIIEPNENLRGTLFNYDVVPHLFSVTMLGMEEKI
ncbi:hypothetical protein ES703_16073 [subsurface metagenome]